MSFIPGIFVLIPEFRSYTIGIRIEIIFVLIPRYKYENDFYSVPRYKNNPSFLYLIFIPSISTKEINMNATG